MFIKISTGHLQKENTCKYFQYVNRGNGIVGGQLFFVMVMHCSSPLIYDIPLNKC